MLTIGHLLKSARTEKNYSISFLENKTKIKKIFLESIEKEEWGNLPNFTIVIGFVRSIAKTVGVDETKAVALLRRDYPPKKVNVNPKPDVGKGFIISPKLVFFACIVFFSFFLLSYLVVQYVSFVSPPKLSVAEPKEGQEVTKREVKVVGTTDLDATISVNNQPVIPTDDGKYETELSVGTGVQELKVVAKSRSGKETIVTRKIFVKI